MTPTLTLLLASAMAQQGSIEEPEYSLQVPPMAAGAVDYTWPSGLRMAVAPEPTRKTVSTTIVIDGGTTDDAVGRSGTGRIVESAWWYTRTPAGRTILDTLVSGLGCSVDSVADHDAITLQSVCPSGQADAAMQVWAQLFTDPLAGITEADLPGIVSRMQADAPVRMLLSERPVNDLIPYLHMQLFSTDHRYFVEPTPNLGHIKLADLKAWVAEHFKPERVTISLVGGWPDVNSGYGPSLLAVNFPPHVLDPKMDASAMQRFPKEGIEEPNADDPSDWWGYLVDPKRPDRVLEFIRNAEPRADSYVMDPPAPPGRPYARYPGPVTYPTVMVGWTLPPSWHADDALYDVVSRLMHEVIAKNLDEPRIERFPGCQVVSGLEATTLVCTALLSKGQEAAGERVAGRIVDQLAFITGTDSDSKQLVSVSTGRAQLGLIRDLMRAQSSLAGLAGSRSAWIANGVHFAGDPMNGIRRMSRAGRVQPDDIRDFVSEWVTRDRAASVQVDPAPVEEVTVRRLPRNLRNRDAMRDRPTYWDRYATGDVMPPMPVEVLTAERLLTQAEDPDTYEIKVLASGLKVIVVRHGDNPVINVRVLALGGRANDPTDNHALTFGREFMRARRGDPLKVGGEWYAFRDDVLHQFGLEAAYDNIEAVLWMMRDLFDRTSPSFKDKGEWMKKWRGQLLEGWYDVSWHVDDLARQHVFGDHPVGQRFDWADLESWGDLGTDDVSAMHEVKWQPESAALLIVTSTEQEADIFGLVEQYFGSWNPPAPENTEYAAKHTLPPMPEGQGRKVELFEREGELAEVRLLCPMPGEAAVARVTEELMRRAMGAPWVSAHSRARVWPGGAGALDVLARVPAAEVGAALKDLLAKLDKAYGADISDDLVRRAAAAAMGRETTTTWDPMVLSGRVAQRWAWGLEPDDTEHVAKGLAALEVADVSAAMKRCAAGVYLGISGDLGTITPALDAAGVQHATVDWQSRGKQLHEAADPKGFVKLEKKKAKQRK